MLETLMRDLDGWWAGLSPEWVFLLALPFLVALAALAADAARSRRRQRRQRVAARLARRTLHP